MISPDDDRATHSDDSKPIYARGVGIYRDAGWRGVLPIPAGKKTPPPKYFTGNDGRWPTDDDIAGFIANYPHLSNLLLRLYYGDFALDIDAYDPKKGAQTLAQAESRWCPLPPTWRSTSRLDDPVSGIRLFTVPLGVRFKGVIKFPELGIGDIEIIQPHHRGIAAWPSVKDGRLTRWYNPTGELVPEGVVPPYGDWPDLPDEWVTALEAGSLHEEVFDGSAPNRSRSAQGQINMEIYEGLIDRLNDNRAPDPLVARRLEKALEELTNGSGSRYDTTRDHVAGLMRLHSYGRVGLSKALEQLYPAYVMEVGDTRPQQVAEKEFVRFTQGAALLVSATKSDWNTNGENTSGENEDSDDQLSWEPIDLTAILSGEYQPLMPTLLARVDGQCLFYSGKVHSLHGESESAKSFVMQVLSVSQINDGNDVLYIDFDDDEESVTGRLIELGADKEQIAKHFVYLRPEVSPKASEEEQAAWLRRLSRRYTLCVIDGVNNAIGVHGLSERESGDIAAWIRQVPKKIAKRTGAAVVAIDHVTKDKINRGRWAIGPQAKMAGLDGAAYTVEVRKVLGRGLRGEISMRIGKDRPGGIRGNCGPARKTDNTMEAARVVIDSTVDPPEVTVGMWGDRDAEGEMTDFRPTHLMQRLSTALDNDRKPRSKTASVALVEGNKQGRMIAYDILIAEGYLAKCGAGEGNTFTVSVKAYRESEDPLSDRYIPSGTTSSSDGSP
jgi:hypothetical protein